MSIESHYNKRSEKYIKSVAVIYIAIYGHVDILHRRRHQLGSFNHSEDSYRSTSFLPYVDVANVASAVRGKLKLSLFRRNILLFSDILLVFSHH